MSGYDSTLTGKRVQDAVEKVESLAAVATSGSYDDLKDTPTIPEAVTETTVSNWGFTKNEGTVTSVAINGTTFEPNNNGLVDLGAIESGGGDYLPTTGGTIEGDVEVIGTLFADSVGSSSYTNENGTRFEFTDRGIFIYRAAGGTTPTLQVRTDQDENKFLAGDGTYKSTAYPLVNHGTSDTTFTLTPNTLHVWDTVSSLTLSLGTEQSGVANEYLFQFTCGATVTTLSLPDTIKWQENLAIEQHHTYQISILNGYASVLSFPEEFGGISPA